MGPSTRSNVSKTRSGRACTDVAATAPKKSILRSKVRRTKADSDEEEVVRDEGDEEEAERDDGDEDDGEKGKNARRTEYVPPLPLFLSFTANYISLGIRDTKGAKTMRTRMRVVRGRMPRAPSTSTPFLLFLLYTTKLYIFLMEK